MKAWTFWFWIIVVALVMGRPTMGVHEQECSDAIAKTFNIKKDSKFLKFSITYGSDAVAEYHDWYLFTFVTINGNVVSVGALRIVIVRETHLITNFLTL